MGKIMKRTIFYTLALMAITASAFAHHPCSSPLVLDLDGNGLALASKYYGVEFDINADGTRDRIGWTASDSHDGLLWLDLDRNGRADDGSELFGTSTRLHDGGLAANGFEALAQYDDPERGGNGDGQIDRDDRIWPFLHLWIDTDHDGITDRGESHHLRKKGVVSIGLSFAERHEMDGGLNVLAYEGSFRQIVHRYGRRSVRDRTVVDVIFATWSPLIDE